MTTDNHSTPSPDLADTLHALVDGQLPADRQAAAHQRLAGDTTAQDTLRAWQTQRDALRALHQNVLREDVPESMRAAPRRAEHAHQQRHPCAR